MPTKTIRISQVVKAAAALTTIALTAGCVGKVAKKAVTAPVRVILYSPAQPDGFQDANPLGEQHLKTED